MVVRDQGDSWHGGAQPDHGDICGVITQAWGNGALADPWERSALSVAVRRHDDGRAVWEHTPGVGTAPPTLRTTFGNFQALPARHEGDRCRPPGGWRADEHGGGQVSAMRVAVVGGSLAGVTTALLLSDLGHLADALDGVASTGVDAALASWQVVALERGRAFLERTRDMGRRLQGRSGQWWPDDPANRFGLGQATVEAQL